MGSKEPPNPFVLLWAALVACGVALTWSGVEKNKDCDHCVFATIRERTPVYSSQCIIVYEYTWKEKVYSKQSTIQCPNENTSQLDLCISSFKPSAAYPTSCLVSRKGSFANNYRIMIAGFVCFGVAFGLPIFGGMIACLVQLIIVVYNYNGKSRMKQTENSLEVL